MGHTGAEIHAAGDTSPAHQSERRLVSVLFTDMVGYTATIDALGAETSVHFTRMLYEMLTKVVTDHGGVVRGFAGDSIMAVFGIPEALEDAALRACAAGLAVHTAMEQAADDIEARFGVRPQMRVGVCSGAAVIAAVEGEAGALTAVGNVVNLASRIQSLAPEGGSLICDTTRRLVEWRVELGFDGEHEIKGLTRTQRLWHLHGVRDGATRFDASVHQGLSRYVGRAAERAAIDSAFAGSVQEQRLIDLMAEPGLGKTRLVYEFLRSEAAAGARIFIGHCTAAERQAPFRPFIEIVRGAYSIENADTADAAEAKLREGLSRAALETEENIGLLMNLLGLPPPPGALAGLDGVLIGLRLRALLPALLRARCQLGQVILFIEDIHWIDSASEDLLHNLIEDPAHKNLLLLTTRRPEYVPDWLGTDKITTLALAPLSEDDLADLVRSRLDVDDLPPALGALIARRAGGNPLFGEEILSYLIEQGALQVENRAAVVDADAADKALPSSMQALLAARIEQLGPTERRVLQAAAAIGRQFDPGLLAAVSGTTDPIGPVLSRLQTLDLVHRRDNAPDYMFKHVLLRDTVYQSLLTDTRAALHLRIASAIEERNAANLPEVAETLAHHYSLTGRADMAFRYAAMAGAKALGVASMRQAQAYFATALALYDADPDCASDADFAAFLGNYALCCNIALDVLALIELAPRVRPILARVGDSGDHVQFLHHYVSCLVCNNRFHEAHAVQQDLNAMAERLGDPKSRAYALVNDLSVAIYCALLPNAKFDARKAQIEAALDSFDDAYLQNFFLATVGWNELTRGRVLGARQSAERMIAFGRNEGDPRALGYGTAMQALVAVCTDDHAAALARSEEALSLARAPFETAIAESSRVGALVALGRPGALAAVQAFIDETSSAGSTLFVGVPQTMLGVGLAMEGRIAEGLAQIERTIAARDAEGMRIGTHWNKLFLSELYLRILLGEGDASPGVLLRNMRCIAGVMFRGEARIRALVAQSRENPQWDPDGHFFAHGEMILGLLDKKKRRVEDARAHLETARRIVAPLGASPMLSRIEAALADLA